MNRGETMTGTESDRSDLAINGGPRGVQSDLGNLFKWPIITQEDEEAVLGVLRGGAAISRWDISAKFEEEFSQWQGCEFAITFPNGTSAILAGLFGLKIGVGDEVICPSITYWASALPCFSLGATPVFADIDSQTLCLNPEDFESRITDNTKAVVVVHYSGYPAEMDAIIEIAERREISVLEDVSHVQGGIYKGSRTGSFGRVSAASLMSGKSLVAGEGGVAWTDDQEVYDRMVAWGHYTRFTPEIKTEYLRKYAGLPMGGIKGRLNQMSSALGRVQLRHYDERCEVLRRSINHFWDLLEDVPGVKPHRVERDSGSNMAGWYSPKGHYCPEELGGLSITGFSNAVSAEGFEIRPGCNLPLHLHPIFSEADIYGHGAPTRNAHSKREIRQPRGSLPKSEAVSARVFGFERFTQYRPELIQEYAGAIRKVSRNHGELLGDDPGNPPGYGEWSSSSR